MTLGGAKKTILVKYWINYDELVDTVYTYMELDWNVFKLNLWFRNSVSLSTFTIVQLGYEDDIHILYHMKLMLPHMAFEIYVKVEPQNRCIHSDHDARQTSFIQFDFEMELGNMLPTPICESKNMIEYNQYRKEYSL